FAVGDSQLNLPSFPTRRSSDLTVHQTETITITGTNDVPEVAAALTSNVAEGDPGYSLDLLSGASDKDDGETASLSVANVTYKVRSEEQTAALQSRMDLVGRILS